MNSEERSLLLSALARAMRQSAFWLDRLRALGIREDDLIDGFPYEQLPLVSKSDLLADQAENPPFGKLLAVPPEEIRRIHRTSGTSATPLFIALTERDIEDTYTSSMRAFRLAGMRPGERVVHCLNFNMWSGGVSDYIPIERLGATGVPFGVGNTSLLLHTVRRLQITAISSTPSYMLPLAERCRSELGIEPTGLGLRRGYFGGEGLLQVPGIRQRIEREFGIVAIDANYGMSEIQSIIGGEEPGRDGLVSHTYGILLTELVDAKGQPMAIEPGASGEFVFSTLRRQAQPLFRYRTNDLAEIIEVSTGEDGLSRMRFRVLGRSDQMLVIKGVNFFPQSMMSVIAEFPGQLGSDFRVLRPAPGSIGELDVVLEAEGEDVARAALALKVEERTRALLQVRVRVHWVPPGFLPRDGNKVRYLINSENEIAGLAEHMRRPA